MLTNDATILKIKHEVLYQVAKLAYAGEFDDWNVDAIYSESFATPRIGQAIMNRLLKAAGHQVLHV